MHRLTQVFVTLVVSTVLVAGISLTARADAPAPAQFTPAALVPAGSQEIDSIRNSNKPWLPGQDSRFSSQDALPVLFILGLVARLGIKWVIKWYGKTQIKKAAKSYLLNKVSRNKWGHILDPKHKWSRVNVKSKEQVAELMSRAMAEGSHSKYKGAAMQAVWKYKGKVIVVTYSKQGGQISNGWVR